VTRAGATSTEPAPPRRVLPVIVAAQFAGTSLWFAVNAVMPELQRAFAAPPEAVGTLTSAVQLGFILGTLVFALLALADRIAARHVFLACALLGATFNALAAWLARDLAQLVALRALTGFCLAGIYPVGMKIAAGWYQQGLGGALGWLIGALALGTGLPHALRAIGTELPWQSLMFGVSLLAVVGGLALWLLVPDSPHLPVATRLQWRALAAIAHDRRLRASVLGYFGQMVELYTMWVLLPAIVATRLAAASAVSWASFATIAAGALGCVAGGLAARHIGSARVAFAMLATSGLCCLLAPWALRAPGDALFALWLGVWGFSVAGDSPQFSALTATNAPREGVGSVLTLVNSIGFAISIASIQLFVALAQQVALDGLLPWLALGPAFGLWALAPLLRTAAHRGTVADMVDRGR
jgi:MFS transporter, DHA1 family, inner membrane transport protein